MFRSFSFQFCQRVISLILILAIAIGPECSYAQSTFVSMLPEPGEMIGQSPTFVPILVKGLVVHPDKPLNFDFIVDSGNDSPDAAVIQEQSARIAKYFLAALTVPEAQLWVNLSPYEKDRIIEDELGQTVLGRDMLAQDYILKQLTASMIYPEQGLGKEFWVKVYKEAAERFGTTDIPVETFNKVWIMPEQAVVYEKDNAVYITTAKLKVMLDSDYLAEKAVSHTASGTGDVASAEGQVSSAIKESQELSKRILREVIIPALEREVNEGRNFAVIRQVYHAAILAKWYRELIQNTLLSDAYVGKNRVEGVTSDEKALKEEIYQRYIAAYKKGVFNLIKEESDPATGEILPHKYFSGGISDFAMRNLPLTRTADAAMAGRSVGRTFKVDLAMSRPVDAAMSEIKPVPPVPDVRNNLPQKQADDQKDKKKKREESTTVQPQEDTVEISPEAWERLRQEQQKGKDAAMAMPKKAALMLSVATLTLGLLTGGSEFAGTLAAAEGSASQKVPGITAVERADQQAIDELVEMTLRGNSQAVMAALRSKVVINGVHSKTGVSVLMAAAFKGDKAVVALLLAQGANINIDGKENKNGATSLILASQNGHLEVVEQLLAAGANVEAKANNGLTALMLASQNGHAEVVEQLLAAGADINIRASNDLTALMAASQNGHEKVAALLLARGADVNARDKDNNWTVLILASQNGYEKIVALLLDKGADVNVKEKHEGRTALIQAAQQGHVGIVELLLAKRADMEAKTSDGSNALTLAAQQGHKDVVALLLAKGADVNSRRNDGATALMLASLVGYSEVVGQLLAANADINAQNKTGETALLAAAHNGYKEIVARLIEKGAVVNTSRPDGGTALMLAAQNGHKDVVELLLAKGAMVEAKLYNEATALFLASQEGHKEIVEFLLAKGADANARLNDGFSALMQAAKNGHKEIVELLLAKGAIVSARDNQNNWTALIAAADGGHREIVELLLTKVADIKGEGGLALIQAAQAGRKAVSAFLIMKGADVNAKRNDGGTALIAAAQNGDKEIVEQLLGANADVNTNTRDLKALILAAQGGHLEVVKLLLAKGAEVNARGYAGVTALIATSQNGYAEIVKLLLAKGAAVNARRDDGATALILASQYSHKEVVERLIAKGADVNARANNGATALSVARTLGQFEIVQILRAAGATDNAMALPKHVSDVALQWQVGESSLTADAAMSFNLVVRMLAASAGFVGRLKITQRLLINNFRNKLNRLDVAAIKKEFSGLRASDRGFFMGRLLMFLLDGNPSEAEQTKVKELLVHIVSVQSMVQGPAVLQAFTGVLLSQDVPVRTRRVIRDVFFGAKAVVESVRRQGVEGVPDERFAQLLATIESLLSQSTDLAMNTDAAMTGLPGTAKGYSLEEDQKALNEDIDRFLASQEPEYRAISAVPLDRIGRKTALNPLFYAAFAAALRLKILGDNSGLQRLAGYQHFSHNPVNPYQGYLDRISSEAARPDVAGVSQDIAGITLRSLWEEHGLRFDPLMDTPRGSALYPGAAKFISDLKTAGIKVGVGTTSHDADTLLRALGLEGLDAVVDANVAYKEGISNSITPAGVYLGVAKKLGIDPKQCVVVVTSPMDIKAAREAGFGLVIGMALVGYEDILRKSGAQIVVTDMGGVSVDEMLAQLPGARGVILNMLGVVTNNYPAKFFAFKETIDRYLKLRAEQLGEPFLEFTWAEFQRFMLGDASWNWDSVGGLQPFFASRNINVPADTSIKDVQVAFSALAANAFDSAMGADILQWLNDDFYNLKAVALFAVAAGVASVGVISWKNRLQKVLERMRLRKMMEANPTIVQRLEEEIPDAERYNKRMKIAEFLPLAVQFMKEGYNFSILYTPEEGYLDHTFIEPELVQSSGFDDYNISMQRYWENQDRLERAYAEAAQGRWVITTSENIRIVRGMKLTDSAMNGGIGIQNIDVQRKAGGAKIRFNEDVIRDVIKNGFNGFTPVIINITPVASPLAVLGLATPEASSAEAELQPAREPELSGV